MREPGQGPQFPVSVVLRRTTIILIPVLLLFSVFLLIRGHNDPGGGFAGGLVASAAIALYSLAFGTESTYRDIRINPRLTIAVGLAIAASSAILGLLVGDPILTGLWATLNLPIYGEVKVGTPLLFDVGVYLVVIGAAVYIILTLEEED